MSTNNDEFDNGEPKKMTWGNAVRMFLLKCVLPRRFSVFASGRLKKYILSLKRFSPLLLNPAVSDPCP